MNLSASDIIPKSTKWAFVTRRVTRSHVCSLSQEFSKVKSGDLILGKIIEIGQHKKIQLAEGRPSESYLGDYVVLACGDRYAPDQFEGIAELDAFSSDLLAGGGVLGKMRFANNRMLAPTRLQPVGLLKNNLDITMNINQYALQEAREKPHIPVIGVVGTSMNAGKTTTAASLAFGLRQVGYKVAALKITGTGSFGDYNAFKDAGCRVVADFTDVGMASTYRQPLLKILDGFNTLLSYAKKQDADIAVVEIADGIFQKETAQLLSSSSIKNQFNGVLFAAGDALSAVGGVHLLREIGINPLAVSGKVCRSPLAVSETKANSDIRVASRDELRNPKYLKFLLRDQLADFVPSSHDKPPYRIIAA